MDEERIKNYIVDCCTILEKYNIKINLKEQNKQIKETFNYKLDKENVAALKIDIVPIVIKYPTSTYGIKYFLLDKYHEEQTVTVKGFPPSVTDVFIRALQFVCDEENPMTK